MTEYSNKLRKADIIFIICTVIVALAIWIIPVIRQNGGVAKTVVVTVDGKEYGSYPLNKNDKITIKTDSGMNILEIKDGKAKMADADCKDKYCVKHNAISKNGESIICLPHKLVVTVSDKFYGTKEKDTVDVVVS